MTSRKLVIDDPEAREQQRTQVRHRHLKVIRGCVITGLSLFALFAGVTWAERVIGNGRPATIVAVDRARDVVSVTYTYHGENVTMTIGVDDASAYSPGDAVRAFNATDSGVWALDREPLAPHFVRLALVYGTLTVLAIAVGCLIVTGKARFRRPNLATPWERVDGEAWPGAVGDWYAFLPYVDDGSFWKLGEPLPPAGPFHADIAGDPTRRLLLRVAGTTRLIRATRTKTKQGWTRHRVLAWDSHGPNVACRFEVGGTDALCILRRDIDADAIVLPDHVAVVGGPDRLAIRANAWPAVVIARAMTPDEGRLHWPGLWEPAAPETAGAHDLESPRSEDSVVDV